MISPTRLSVSLSESDELDSSSDPRASAAMAVERKPAAVCWPLNIGTPTILPGSGGRVNVLTSLALKVTPPTSALTVMVRGTLLLKPCNTVSRSSTIGGMPSVLV